MSVKRYFLRYDGKKEEEVSMLDFAAAEQKAGVSGTIRGPISTKPISSGFAVNGVFGYTKTVSIEEIMDEF